MSDIIALLPDSVANQIAAGEVVQRPASAVKELLENSLDSGATDIKLIVKDAGKTLMHVIDNGCGMSETDARMSFERHATSKIRNADDLFKLRTMGFRGEALASIAAIAHVELKTKRVEDELGVKVEVEGSKVTNQEAYSCSNGTSLAIKNLFYNVPARRNFLKTDAVELRHIIDEFQRVALPNPKISFSLHHNNAEIFNLSTGSFKQRIMGVFGKNYESRLIPVQEDTEIVKIKGFVSKPEFAKKTRGEQFFFLNNRFVKSPYLHHAIQGAFETLISKGNYASYYLHLEVDPKTIDINIHPTKTEVKFEDEKAIYAIIRAAIKKSLGQFNITPSIDFEQEAHLYNMPLKPEGGVIKLPTINVDETFNPFAKDRKPRETHRSEREPVDERKVSNAKNWGQLYDFRENTERQATFEAESATTKNEDQQVIDAKWDEELLEGAPKYGFQLHNKYILSSVKSGFIVIDQQRAHERIVYEQTLARFDKGQRSSQQELFPKTLELTPADYALVQELDDEIHALGFDLKSEGGNRVIINGVPADVADFDSVSLIEGVIENYKTDQQGLQETKRESIARSIARNVAIKYGKSLSQEEINNIVDGLFACEQPNVSPSGHSTIVNFSIEDLERLFKQ